MRAAGATTTAIRNELGVSMWAVQKYSEGVEVPQIRHAPVRMAKNWTDDTALIDAVYDQLKRLSQPTTVEALADRFAVPPKTIRACLALLQKNGKNIDMAQGVELHKQLAPADPSHIDISRFKGKTIKFGLTGDNHLASKYSRLDVLNALFDIWQNQGIDTVYQLGNMIDGDARFNKFDLLAHGMEDQVNYFVENWPKRPGMTTKFITGDDHEGWYVQREGVDIGRVIQGHAREEGREDLVYLGHMEHDIVFQAKHGPAVMRLIHAGGGSAYATSYSVQKYAESLQGGEKPSILLVGHYHKAEYGYPREIHAVQCGTTEDQTPFMRKLKIQAHVGGWTISFDIDDHGLVHGFTPQFHPFYDRAFYGKGSGQWKYRFDDKRNKQSSLVKI